MGNNLDEQLEYVDEAGKAFAADVEPMFSDLLAEIEQLRAARDAALVESERIRREAVETFDAAMAEAKKKYCGGVREAAQKRAKESERPEQISVTCDRFLRSIEHGSGGMQHPSFILKDIAQSESSRRYAEEQAERRQRRMNILRGIG